MGLKETLSRNYKFLVIWLIFIAVSITICFIQTYGFTALLLYFFGFLCLYFGLTLRYQRINLSPIITTDNNSISHTNRGETRTRGYSVTRVRDEIKDNLGLKIGLIFIGVIFILIMIFLLTNGLTNILMDVLIVIDTITGIMAIILTVERLNRARGRVSRWSNNQQSRFHRWIDRFKDW